jgi:hypothetical protein
MLQAFEAASAAVRRPFRDGPWRDHLDSVNFGYVLFTFALISVCCLVYLGD